MTPVKQIDYEQRAAHREACTWVWTDDFTQQRPPTPWDDERPFFECRTFPHTPWDDEPPWWARQ